MIQKYDEYLVCIIYQGHIEGQEAFDGGGIIAYWFLDGGGEWRYFIDLVKPGDVVVGSNSQINKFYETFAEGVQVLRLKTPPTLFGERPYRLLYNILLAKWEYWKHFRKVADQDVYTNCKVYTITFFSYIKKMKKRNRVWFLLAEDIDSKRYFNTHRGGKTWFKIPLKIIGYIMGVDVGISRILERPAWYLKEDTI